ncbi:rsbT co-antagonist protein RsbR [Stella humosa]|uniref:RsbT co-antagonist protein RsbR n=1 Tax=Stella humosa TaxID=94 RepID=A0A3N1MBX7_9PROT|nr:STAS domain-containing protein [Stella humosa]ROQ01241.1 rsbT co-antagonist protein RsbR [Stella humosa]BBK31615.1 polyvinylalcohol dehydrogenase [Stella humosa]
MARQLSGLDGIIAAHQSEILGDWQSRLAEAGSERRLTAREIDSQCRALLDALRESAAVEGSASDRLKDMLADMSKTRAVQGFTIAETVSLLHSLKKPLLAAIGRELVKSPAAALREVVSASELIDGLSLLVMDEFVRMREEIIIRQQQEIAELSTPVVKLWDGILAVPLIGTLDSSRTQVVMENLLQAIVDQSALMTIIDITGVPTVDTLVAQHLLKTIAAARLMGADCIISGIRPQIAQTMVHLGVELSVVSKATLAEALAHALAKTGRMVVQRRAAEA